MTREEILAVTESDTKGCESINKVVHEKLGLCWHEKVNYDIPIPTEGKKKSKVFHFIKCSKCGEPNPSVTIPDYTHDISEAWTIKKWYDKSSGILRTQYNETVLDATHLPKKGDFILWNTQVVWASPLDRCKAFLLMGTKEGDSTEYQRESKEGRME